MRIISGTTVRALESDNSNAITAVDTDRGRIECDYAVVAAGPWVRSFWEMLELPMEVGICNPATREVTEGIPMWIYWSLQEGTLGVDPKLQVTNDGAMPPVIHIDTDAPLYSDEDGRLITDQLWGIYSISPTSTLVACRVALHPLSSTSPRQTFQWTPVGRLHRSLW